MIKGISLENETINIKDAISSHRHLLSASLGPVHLNNTHQPHHLYNCLPKLKLKFALLDCNNTFA